MDQWRGMGAKNFNKEREEPDFGLQFVKAPFLALLGTVCTWQMLRLGSLMKLEVFAGAAAVH